jgi:hypothetical protein
MIKWKLMLLTLPFTLVILLLTFVRTQTLAISPLFEFSDTAPIITVTALVIGFMLSGVMADHKEGERLPAEIACGLQAIEDCIQADAVHLSEHDLAALKQHYATLCQSVVNWLFNRENAEPIYAALRAIVLAQGTSPTFKVNGLRNIDAIRRSITRIDVIRRTDFIATGYVLLDVFVTLTLGLLVFAHFKNEVAQYCIIGSISLVYVYMLRLIRDLDNPFDYEQDGSAGVSEVDYFPIVEALKRLGYVYD